MTEPREPGYADPSFDADRHRAILDSALDAIVSIDAEGIITEFNPAAEKTFGYTRAEAVGRSMAELIIPVQLRERHAAGLARYLATGETTILGRRIEITAIRRDGKEFPVELSILRIAGSAPPMFTGFIRDITQQRELEAQLRHAQKMDAIGQLAGGVAHDFNNILTVIQGHAALLLDLPVHEVNSSDSVRQIADAADRAASLTRQLLAFSRKQVMQPANINLNDVVANMTRMLQRILGEHITLDVQTSRELPPVHADVGMLEQVILNLAVNARDAMPEGGRLTLGTSVRSIDEAFVRENSEATAGRFVRLSVTDTGCGIPSDDLPRIFEPFFTTKDVQKGTGLGLATVYGIVKQHHGWISVRTALGSGTTFDTYLPAVGGAPQPAYTPAPVTDAKTGDESVLVIEDEAPVRRLARMVLERYGYRVLEAADGVAARAAWLQHRDEIRLVLTDVVLPGGVSGFALADAMLKERPQLKVLVTSGYNAEVFRRDLKGHEQMVFLQKPYHPSELLRTVRSTLDGA